MPESLESWKARMDAGEATQGTISQESQEWVEEQMIAGVMGLNPAFAKFCFPSEYHNMKDKLEAIRKRIASDQM